MDIVFPKNNKEEFLKLAKKLEITIAFASPKKIRGLQVHQARIGKKDTLIWKAGDNLREIIEKSSVNIIFGLEELRAGDFLHHRASGLNQVLCALLRKKDKTIGFSFSSLLRASPIKRAQIIGRMQQNFRLCKKYKVKTIIASFAEKPYEMRRQGDLAGLFKSLGMDPRMVKESFALTKNLE